MSIQRLVRENALTARGRGENWWDIASALNLLPEAEFGGPGERVSGHAATCSRHAADVRAWEALWA